MNAESFFWDRDWPAELQVRCCCDARLLGYLPTPGSRPQGSYATYVRMPLRAVEVEAWGPGVNPGFEVVELAVGTAVIHREIDGSAVRKSFPAYKAPHLPIETLRRIPGFREPTAEEAFHDWPDYAA